MAANLGRRAGRWRCNPVPAPFLCPVGIRISVEARWRPIILEGVVRNHPVVEVAVSLYYASQGRHLANNGKFSRHRPLGTRKTAGARHRGWSIEFHEHQSGASVKRTLCSASIRDPQGNRVEYLQGYQSPEAAGEAARQWIDALLAKIRPAGPIDQSIPAPPQ